MQKPLVRNLTILIVLIACAILLNWVWGPRPKYAPELLWQRVTSQEGGFSIEMPGTPTPRNEARTALLFFKVQVAGLELKADHFPADFFAYCYDFPRAALEDDAESLLEQIGKTACAQEKGKMVSLHPIDLDGHVGREVRFDFTRDKHDYACIMRLYLVNRRIYQTAVVLSRYYAAAEPVRRYLDSFKLLRP